VEIDGKARALSCQMRALLQLVDRPLPVVRRTARELLIIGVASATAVTSWRELGARDVGNAVAFAAVAIAFAVRFFAARVVATAVAVAATGLHVVYAWRDGGASHQLLGIAYFLGAILLLGGRDLVARFDDAPSRGRLLHNFWRELSTADRRRLALLVHGVALTLSMLYYVRFQIVAQRQVVPLWLHAGLAGAALVGVLLLFGRAVAALLAGVAGAALAAVLAAHAPVAWKVVGGGYVTMDMPVVARCAPHMLLAATLAATLTVMAAAPWAWRLLARALRKS
jgi:hypothetical protein